MRDLSLSLFDLRDGLFDTLQLQYHHVLKAWLW